MNALPLRTSLTIIYTSILAVFVTGLGLSYHYTLIRQLNDDATSALEEKSRGLRGYLQFKNGAPVLVYSQSDSEEAAFIDDATDYYQVYDARDGRLLTQSPGLQSLGLHYTPDEVAVFRRTPGLHDVQTDRGRVRLSTSVVTPAPGEAYLLQVGELLDRADQTLAAFDRLLVWRTLEGLVVAALLGRWLAGRALAPLSRLAHATHAIGITNLGDRLPVRGADDELDQVAHSFNQALARVEHSVGEMRQFSAALAHELRTPLAILRGDAELALNPTLSSEELRQTLTGQLEEFDRLTRLINQILTLARAETGEIPIAREPIDVAALGVSVVDQIEPVAAARGIALTCVVEGDDVCVTGDAGWLERLLLILLDNAIKFTPHGGRISVAVSRQDTDACIAITDTGIGIAPDALPHVFERFYRVESARTREGAGSGLGLALARWIVERHHATIRVDSRPGHGSTFTVTLAACRDVRPSD